MLLRVSTELTFEINACSSAPAADSFLKQFQVSAVIRVNCCSSLLLEVINTGFPHVQQHSSLLLNYFTSCISFWGSLRFLLPFEFLSSSTIFVSSLLLSSQQRSSARGGLLPGNSPECMIKTLISNLSPERLMWLISSNARQSSCGGSEHGGSTRAKLIFTMKWDVWFTHRRPASSSNSSSEEQLLQNRPKLHLPFFFFLPSCLFAMYCANLL